MESGYKNAHTHKKAKKICEIFQFKMLLWKSWRVFEWFFFLPGEWKWKNKNDLQNCFLYKRREITIAANFFLYWIWIPNTFVKIKVLMSWKEWSKKLGIFCKSRLLKVIYHFKATLFHLLRLYHLICVNEDLNQDQKLFFCFVNSSLHKLRINYFTRGNHRGCIWKFLRIEILSIKKL